MRGGERAGGRGGDRARAVGGRGEARRGKASGSEFVRRRAGEGGRASRHWLGGPGAKSAATRDSRRAVQRPGGRRNGGADSQRLAVRHARAASSRAQPAPASSPLAAQQSLYNNPDTLHDSLGSVYLRPSAHCLVPASVACSRDVRPFRSPAQLAPRLAGRPLCFRATRIFSPRHRLSTFSLWLAAHAQHVLLAPIERPGCAHTVRPAALGCAAALSRALVILLPPPTLSTPAPLSARFAPLACALVLEAGYSR